MQHVSEQVNGAGTRTASTRGRWLFAIVMFAIGIVPVTESPKPSAPRSSGMPWGHVLRGQRRLLEPDRLAIQITMTALLNANKATTATMIHPGQTLCLPRGRRPRRHDDHRPRLRRRRATPAPTAPPSPIDCVPGSRAVLVRRHLRRAA